MTAADSESMTEPVRYASSIDAYAFGEHRSLGAPRAVQLRRRADAGDVT
jgi:hypothetical protein